MRVTYKNATVVGDVFSVTKCCVDDEKHKMDTTDTLCLLEVIYVVVIDSKFAKLQV